MPIDRARMKRVVPDIVARFSRISSDDPNEAETRSKLIDEILREVLGWTIDDIQVEKRIPDGEVDEYADYQISTGSSSLVIEAKRAGIKFLDIPHSRMFYLRGEIMHGALGKAIKQVRSYAMGLGIGFAAVTNGHQWVVFPAIRTDGVTFASSKAFLFPSLASALGDDLDLFYDLLSREGMINGALSQHLLGGKEDQIETRRLNAFYTHGLARSRRNEVYPLIEDAITNAFTDEFATESSELLQKIYVRSADRTRFDERINMYIARRQHLVGGPTKRPMKNKDADSLNRAIEQSTRKSIPTTVMILGTVGAGKTTFLKYTRSVGANRHFEQDQNGDSHAYWIYIDYRKMGQSEISSGFLFASILDFIMSEPSLCDYKKIVEPAYKKEIDALLSGPMFLLAKNPSERDKLITEMIMRDYNAKVPYVERICQYVASSKPIFLVIDNVDQFEADDIQGSIFNDAMSVSNRLGLNLAISLRGETYQRRKNLPIFNAFDFDVFYIDPPEVKAVLSRRFFLAHTIVKGRSGNFVGENGANFHVSDLSVFIELLQESVLGTEVGDVIEIFSAQDIRLAMRLTREFLHYGYTSPEKALRLRKAGQKYILPRHEALRAIMLGKSEVYSEDTSNIPNVMDSYLGQSKLQMLRLFILSALVNYSSNPAFEKVPVLDIQKHCRSVGVSDESTLLVISEMAEKRLVFTASHGEVTAESSVIPSRMSGFIIRIMVFDFTFLENTMMDTFITDNVVWEKLRKLTDSVLAERDMIQRMHYRKDRIRIFFEYMANTLELFSAEARRRNLPIEWRSNPLIDGRATLYNNLDRALRSAVRNRSNESLRS